MSKYTESLKQLPREYDGQVDFLLPQYGLHNYPVSPYRELRIPLPLREVVVGDEFGTTAVEPQYAVSYVDEAYYQDWVAKGKVSEKISEFQMRWYMKLGILTTHEQAVNDEVTRLKELRDSLPDDSFMKGKFVV